MDWHTCPSSSDSGTESTQERVECVKARLQVEGREARNLIAYSVPIQDRKPPSQPHSANSDKIKTARNQCKDIKKTCDRTNCKKDKRIRSASAGRDPQASLRARHWGFLFRNLEQAVHEIYQTCEDDESIIECKEAILMLERYANDFQKLIEWLKIKWEYDHTPPPERPTSLTWEIRTSSPGKLIRTYKKHPMQEAKRILNFEQGHAVQGTITSSSQLKQGNSNENCCHKLISSNPSIILNSANNHSHSNAYLVKEHGNSLDYKLLSENRIEEEAHICQEAESLKNLREKFVPKELNLHLNPSDSASVLTKDLQQIEESKECPATIKAVCTDTREAKLTLDSPINSISTTVEVFNNSTSSKLCALTKDTKTITCNSEIQADSLNEVPINLVNCNKEKNKCSKLEIKKANEVHHIKNIFVKPGPLVNMNKASQVRKAFNQNRTPQKSLCSNAWKTALNQSESKENCSKNQVFVEGNRTCLVRSLTTLEGSNLSSKLNANKKMLLPERSFSISTDNDKDTSSSSLASSTNTLSSVQSWADKVKGTPPEGKQDSVLNLSLQDEEEGWEIVKRGRRSHGGSSASLNSQTPPNSFTGSQVKSFVNKHKPKNVNTFNVQNRFRQPSTAVSMPSLNIFQDGCDWKHNLRKSIGYTPTDRKLPANKLLSYKNERKLNEQIDSRRSKLKDSLVEGSYKDSIKGEQKSRNISSLKKSITKDSAQEISLKSNQELQVQFSKSEKNLTNVEKCHKDASNISKRNATLLNNVKDDGKYLEVEVNYEKKSKENYPIVDELITGTDGPKENYQIEELIAEEKSKSVHEHMLDYCSIEKTLAGTILDNASVESVNLSPPKEHGSESDDESEREEEQMRSNAAALESAVNEEMRLKKEIEDTKRETIAVCAGIEEEDESGEKSSEKNVNEFASSSYSTTSIMSWAEEMDFIENVDAARQPGRVLHMHEKLSSPSRKLPISEKYRRHKEKLAKAQELRGKLIQAKTEKLKDLFRKIDEVNLDKERLLLEKRDLFECKMERAEEKRKCHLQEIVNKAHDEENKAREIAFINGLEAQNKLHDIMQQHQSHESRLADRAEERCRKLEEKAAKEVAAQERRKALEAERQARMLELCEKRRRRCERIDRQQAERREELLEQAREKARDREERLTALQQAQLAKESELVKKIQQKQEETARRHDENIEQIRQRALESSIMKFSRGCDDAPKLLRYETKKLCTLCNSLIASEVYLLSHLRGKHHQEALKVLHKSDITVEETQTYNIKFIVDAPSNIEDPQITRDEERRKALKKRCKKIRNRMMSRSQEFLKTYHPPPCKDTPFKMRMSKALTQIGRLIANQGLGPWLAIDVTALDKHLLELLRLLEATCPEEQHTFASLNGFKRLFPILNLITANEEEGQPCVIPTKSLTFCARVLLAACRQSKSNCDFLLRSNMIGDTVDFLMRRFSIISSDMSNSINQNALNSQVILPSDSATAAVMELGAEVLKVLSESKSSESNNNIDQLLQDVVSYCVSMGVTDKISWYFSHIQNPVDNDPPSSQIILAGMSFISTLAATIAGKSNSSDPTQLIGTFHVTEACGVVSLLYGLLLHQGSRSSSPPPIDFLSSSTVAISGVATTLLHSLAELDLNMFQSVLGSEGISLEFRHIASFLLWYCSHWNNEEILHNVIALVGFFTVNNKENQMVIQSGETPSVLQKLCSLPWQYFSEKRLTEVLFPTLLACCLHNDDNLNILKQEMSFQVLEDFLNNNDASKCPLMKILKKKKNAKSIR